jgi:hypothetical protein
MKIRSSVYLDVYCDTDSNRSSNERSFHLKQWAQPFFAFVWAVQEYNNWFSFRDSVFKFQ